MAWWFGTSLINHMSVADSNLGPEIRAYAEKCHPTTKGARRHGRKIVKNRKPYPTRFAKYFKIQPHVSEKNVANVLFGS